MGKLLIFSEQVVQPYYLAGFGPGQWAAGYCGVRSQMELQKFIEETLVQVAHGIENANARLAESQAAVNPRNVVAYEKNEDRLYGYLDEDDNKEILYRRVVELIEFDVSVVATKGKETKGGIGIAVGSVSLGSSGKSDASQRSESRIKFKVPMILPNSLDD